MRRGSKRLPRFASYDEAKRFELITKAQLWELYRDLFQQTHGEDRSDFVDDARKRLALLKAQGIAP